jgi:hypothetical protein
MGASAADEKGRLSSVGSAEHGVRKSSLASERPVPGFAQSQGANGASHNDSRPHGLGGGRGGPEFDGIGAYNGPAFRTSVDPVAARVSQTSPLLVRQSFPTSGHYSSSDNPSGGFTGLPEV